MKINQEKQSGQNALFCQFFGISKFMENEYMKNLLKEYKTYLINEKACIKSVEALFAQQFRQQSQDQYLRQLPSIRNNNESFVLPSLQLSPIC